MTTASFDGTQTRGWILRFTESVYATEAELTALDQRAGDGDFGTNLAAGVRAAGLLLDRTNRAAGPAETLGTMATAFLDEIGGTSGPLFGLLFQALSRAAPDSGPGLTTAALADGTAQGLAAIRRVGDASPGDKTLVDALTPASAALRAAEGAPPATALATAADDAWRGCGTPHPSRRAWAVRAIWVNAPRAFPTPERWGSPCSSPRPPAPCTPWARIWIRPPADREAPGHR